jgi:hypothetical protein
MNQSDLERARRIDRDEREREALRERLPEMERQAAREQRIELAGQSLAHAERRAKQTIEDTSPAIDRWRAEFVTWAAKGWNLTQRLADLERPLLEDLQRLAAMAAGSVGAARQDRADWGEVLATDQARDAAVDAALERAGALDAKLWPLPEVRGNEFAETLKRLVLQHARFVYKPAERGRQFKRGGHGAR